MFVLKAKGQIIKQLGMGWTSARRAKILDRFHDARAE